MWTGPGHVGNVQGELSKRLMSSRPQEPCLHGHTALSNKPRSWKQPKTCPEMRGRSHHQGWVESLAGFNGLASPEWARPCYRGATGTCFWLYSGFWLTGFGTISLAMQIREASDSPGGKVWGGAGKATPSSSGSWQLGSGVGGRSRTRVSVHWAYGVLCPSMSLRLGAPFLLG